MGKTDQFVEKEKYDKLKEENKLLKQKLKKLDSRLDSIIKVNDKTFKSIFTKNITLEKTLNRFDRILHLSDRQGKTILVEKDQKEELLLAQAKMASMGEMIDCIAHQWKQPLSMISTDASAIIAKKEYGVSDEQEEIESLTHITDITQYLAETIDDFRAFLNDNKRFSYFNLFETLRKLELLTKALIVMNHVELIIDIEDIELLGMENELIQVFMNLISNSNDAFHKKEKHKLIMINIANKTETNITLRFIDSAGGINKDQLQKIFHTGFSTKKETGGTGIGLPMSKTIIENTFHGTISVQNETFAYKEKEYTGAAFYITIPLPKEEE